ncbi:hypothetical protein JQK62_18615, partial [Leptospira santarosai]|nr:hypothetical protein [Leptospira santarosai]
NRHLKSYIKLATHANKLFIEKASSSKSSIQRNLQKFYSEKAYALFSNGFYEESVNQFRLAIQVEPNAPAAKVFISEIAKAYHHLGEVEKARKELEKLRQPTRTIPGSPLREA